MFNRLGPTAVRLSLVNLGIGCPKSSSLRFTFPLHGEIFLPVVFFSYYEISAF